MAALVGVLHRVQAAGRFGLCMACTCCLAEEPILLLLLARPTGPTSTWCALANTTLPITPPHSTSTVLATTIDSEKKTLLFYCVCICASVYLRAWHEETPVAIAASEVITMHEWFDRLERCQRKRKMPSTIRGRVFFIVILIYSISVEVFRYRCIF